MRGRTVAILAGATTFLMWLFSRSSLAMTVPGAQMPWPTWSPDVTPVTTLTSLRQVAQQAAEARLEAQRRYGRAVATGDVSGIATWAVEKARLSAVENDAEREITRRQQAGER